MHVSRQMTGEKLKSREELFSSWNLGPFLSADGDPVHGEKNLHRASIATKDTAFITKTTINFNTIY